MPLGMSGFLPDESITASTFFSHVLAFNDLLIRKEMLQRQVGLGRIICAGLIVTGPIRPPLELPVIKKDFAGVKHLLSFSDRRMPVAVMEEHVALARAYEVVLQIGNVYTVPVHTVQSILIGKTVETKNVVGIDQLHRARMQVRIELHCLDYARRKTLTVTCLIFGAWTIVCFGGTARALVAEAVGRLLVRACTALALFASPPG